MIGRAAALVVRGYQRTLGLLVGGRCRFHPSCSEYAVGILRANGLVKGTILTLWRLVRCGPWTAGGFDEVRRVGPSPTRWLTRVFGPSHG
jgi:putative membrane protein insertion efficiency factor